MTKRKIVAVTGIRSDYDLMTPVYRAIQEHDNLELELIVTGAHLSETYGLTFQEIHLDGFKIADCIHSLLNSDKPSGRVKGLAIQLQGMIQTVERVQPDILLVLGDREESMTTALMGAYMNIPVAHVAGGDRVIGNVDDQVRHAVSKLAHIHFTTNAESAERLIKLGEEEFRVFNTGNPGIDRLKDVPYLSRSELSERLGFNIDDEDPVILVIQHVISTEIEHAYDQMKATMEAIKELGYKTIISYPNSDAGGQQMINAIKEYEHLPFIHISKNIPRLEFVNIMRNSSCLLGNSSAGILEAPFLKLPVINVGNRQKGRLHAENVQFINHSVQEIKVAVNRALFDTEYRKEVINCSNPYGDGNAAANIVNLLYSVELDGKLLIKEITY